MANIVIESKKRAEDPNNYASIQREKDPRGFQVKLIIMKALTGMYENIKQLIIEYRVTNSDLVKHFEELKRDNQISMDINGGQFLKEYFKDFNKLLILNEHKL